MKTLHLTLKKKWFDMIASGEKTEEYRELKAYWSTRLIDVDASLDESKGESKVVPEDICFDVRNGHNPEAVLKSYRSSLRKFDAVIFRNGYSGGAPLMSFRNPTIRIDAGNPEWGAEPGKKYFVIKLGERV